MKDVFYIGLCLFFTLQVMHAQDCTKGLMESELLELESLNRSFNHAKALIYADSLQNVLIDENQENCKVFMLIDLKKGESLEHASQFEEAVLHYYNLLDYVEERQFWDIKAEIHLSLARIHETVNREIDCKRNLSIAKELISKFDLSNLMSFYAVRYSSFLRFYGDLDSAKYYAKLAIELGKNKDNNHDELDGNLLMGILSEDIDSIISYLNRCIELDLENQSYYGASINNYSLAANLFDFERYNEGLKYLDKAYELVDSISTKDQKHFFMKYLIYGKKEEYFRNNNQIDSAYYYSELGHYNQIKSIYITDQEKISQIEIQQNIEKQQQINETLRKEQSIFRWIVGVGIITIITLIGFIINYLRDKRHIYRQNEIIKLKNQDLSDSISKQTMLLSEIHHRVKNNLQMVISLLILQSEKSESDIIRYQLQDISDKVRSIALIHDQLYQHGEFESINLEQYFEDLFRHFHKLKLFDYKIDCKNVALNLETVMPLGIITSELISNSIKYAMENTSALVLTITIEKIGKVYKMVYSDNGKGYPKNSLKNSKPGMGSMLIFSMVRQLQATSSTFNQNGTIFELIFSEKKISKI